MCGICGRYNHESRAPVPGELLAAMCRRLAHRGPDGERTWADGPAGLGHRRLVVIDPATGDQPLTNEDGSVMVVANGEIYNYRELRPPLEAQGHQFRTASDIEPIAHLYEQYGDDFPCHLRGMFAIALYDRARRRLLLVRDRLGKKPLHYCIAGGGISFASELWSLVADPAVPREVNLEALYHYLGHLYVPGPLSMLEGVGRVPPAHVLVADEGGVRLQRYWSLKYEPKTGLPPAEQAAHLRARLEEAVALRLRSDVPLGALLSGGIDSAVVTALMAKLAGGVRTYSIGFAEEGFNELAGARATAAALGTEHQEMVVEPAAAACLPMLVRRFGEPFADASALPSYYLAEFARSGVTVALCGDGGDESFAGYDRYGQLLARWQGRPPVHHRLGAAAPAWGHYYSPWRQARRRAALARSGPAEGYAHLVTYMPRELKAMVCSPWFLERTAHLEDGRAVRQAFESAAAESLLDRALAADVATYLPDDLLVKMDIASMCWGLEARSPLLDQEVMAFAATLPVEAKRTAQGGKRLLRQVAAELLPAEVLARPKHGFSVPVESWLRGPLAAMARELLLDGLARRGYFEPRGLARLLGWQRRHDGYGHLVWGLMTLELWHREMADA